ncbi:hypothetical protein ACFE04_025842 [Oxalis oulophora]
MAGMDAKVMYAFCHLQNEKLCLIKANYVFQQGKLTGREEGTKKAKWMKIVQWGKWGSSQSNIHKYENELNVALEKGEPGVVMSEYGFNEPIDWSRDIQVLSDILRARGFTGNGIRHEPDLPSWEVEVIGKPNPIVFRNVEIVLKQLEIDLWEHESYSIISQLPNDIRMELIEVPLKPSWEVEVIGKPNPIVFRNVEIVLKQLEIDLWEHESYSIISQLPNDIRMELIEVPLKPSWEVEVIGNPNPIVFRNVEIVLKQLEIDLWEHESYSIISQLPNDIRMELIEGRELKIWLFDSFTINCAMIVTTQSFRI